jgi:hypothetical protein
MTGSDSGEVPIASYERERGDAELKLMYGRILHAGPFSLGK